MTSNRDWLDLLEEFRRLGGTADNICLRDGNLGRGLFPLDASRPVLVRAPENLLLPLEDAKFLGNKFRVSPNSKMGGAEKAWLEHYMEFYAWGSSARADVERSMADLAGLPESIREILAHSFGILCSAQPEDAVIQERFLHSRVVEYADRQVIMPIVDLINHGASATFDCTNGVAVGGTFAGEVLVRYGGYDTFRLYQSWYFVNREQFALSLPGRFSTALGEIVVHDQMRHGESLQIPDANAVVPLPRLTLGDGIITLSFLALGWKGVPKVPKGIFRRLLREAGLAVSDEPFELILYANRLRFLELLAELDGVRGMAASRALATMCRYQLEALAHSYGAREV